MSSNPIKLSVVIITLNEEKNIGKCLDAAWQVADEVVVIDSFSTDRTKIICEEKKAIFVEHRFDGHIQQKNFAIKQASNDYVLSLDADEVLSDRLISSIEKVKQEPLFDAYTINRMSFYVDRFIKHGHWFPDKKIRLFKKGTGNWGGRNPHDLFELVENKKAPILKGVLYHYTFNSIFEHIRQVNNFSEIGAGQLQDQAYLFLIIKAIFSPIWGFLYGYIVRLGFLDGWYGLTIAVLSSTETFLKYAKAIVQLKVLNKSSFDVIHISSMKTWRGGEQQVANLLLGQQKEGLRVFMIVAKGSELRHFCESNVIPYTEINFRNGFNIFAAFKIKSLSVRFKAKIVHMHCSPSHTLSIFSKLFGNTANLILSRRVIFPVRPNFLSYQKFNYSGISKIICVSESTKEVMMKTVKSTEKLEVIYDGIYLKKFEKIEKSGLKKTLGLEGKKLVGNISAIVSEKDYFTFVDTAEKVLSTESDVHFLIIGSGSDSEAIQNYIDRKKLNSKITMLGFRKDVPELLSILDVFLMTSIMEGLGSTILDAFASKLPVVATNVGGIPEIVIHENTGMLSSCKDAASLSDNVIRLLNNKSLVSNLTDNAYELVSSKFSTNKMVKLTNEVYKNISKEN